MPVSCVACGESARWVSEEKRFRCERCGIAFDASAIDDHMLEELDVEGLDVPDVSDDLVTDHLPQLDLDPSFPHRAPGPDAEPTTLDLSPPGWDPRLDLDESEHTPFEEPLVVWQDATDEVTETES